MLCNATVLSIDKIDNFGNISIEHTTIDKILAMDEIELALAVLLGEIKLPQ